MVIIWGDSQGFGGGGGGGMNHFDWFTKQTPHHAPHKKNNQLIN
jgi:hypothetical protein